MDVNVYCNDAFLGRSVSTKCPKQWLCPQKRMCTVIFQNIILALQGIS